MFICKKKYGSDTTEEDRASGVFFEMDTNCWIPDRSCSSQPIPKAFPDAAVPFARKRQQMSQYVKLQGVPNTNTPDFLSGGYMCGPDCVPMAPEHCLTCSSLSSSYQFLDDGVFVLRTYYGAVVRKRCAAICVCGHIYKWNPADEFIHAIKDNSEGGKLLFLYYKQIAFILFTFRLI